MASTLLFLIVSTLVVCHAQNQLSKHAAKVKAEILDDVEDEVSASCFKMFKPLLTSVTNDRIVASMCTQIKQQKTNVVQVCKQSGYEDIEKIVCKEVRLSEEDRTDRLLKYANVYAELTKTCKTKLGSLKNNDQWTWYNIEQLCDQISTKDKDDYKKQCPNDDYDDVKTVICGGASATLSGLATIGLCLLAQIICVYNKL